MVRHDPLSILPSKNISKGGLVLAHRQFLVLSEYLTKVKHDRPESLRALRFYIDNVKMQPYSPCN